MNDLEIRQSFHKKKLHKYHTNRDTMVIDELGLNHGKSRADIAVISSFLIGYEIKSNSDSLLRLKQQIQAYNSIFDRSYIIVGNRYEKIIHKHVPEWWGIIVSEKDKKDVINFNLIRRAYKNKDVKPISIARLLWREEAVEILRHNQFAEKFLRKPRSILYESLTDIYNIRELQKITIKYLKKRENWRHPEQSFQYDDSSLLSSK